MLNLVKLSSQKRVLQGSSQQCKSYGCIAGKRLSMFVTIHICRRARLSLMVCSTLLRFEGKVLSTFVGEVIDDTFALRKSVLPAQLVSLTLSCLLLLRHFAANDFSEANRMCEPGLNAHSPTKLAKLWWNRVKNP
ncbi:hypothetical protein AVEN_63465-1 [Araneus ventricosus]|uniref:Uncharacterized protein n=1 Tax=Araneus ventricosus TaxID=182803 RepID=A0A4Y2CSA7_ARAVE|nr:hypothetical protein AVEN_63465-1 [Araneus ventricosus]